MRSLNDVVRNHTMQYAWISSREANPLLKLTIGEFKGRLLHHLDFSLDSTISTDMLGNSKKKLHKLTFVRFLTKHEQAA
jgi:hypothetical protein